MGTPGGSVRIHIGTSFQSCIVPFCGNNNTKNPDKFFIPVPIVHEVRSKWLIAMRKKHTSEDLKRKSNLFCCEDHFDLKEDTENYYYITLMNKNKCYLQFKQRVIPHIFECQKDWKMAHQSIREKQKQEIVSQAIQEYEKKQQDEKTLAVHHYKSAAEKKSYRVVTPHPHAKPLKVEIVYEKLTENEIPSVITENTKETLQENSKENSQQINIPKSMPPPPLIWNKDTKEELKISDICQSTNTNAGVSFAITSNSTVIHETPSQSNKGTITNTLKRKDISTNTMYISDNDIQDMLSKRIKVTKSYTEYYNSHSDSDNESKISKYSDNDKNWEFDESETDSDFSLPKSDDTFSKQCLQITRINHKKSWEKYFGLPSDCYWVIDSLADELIVRYNSRHINKKDIIELVLRKLHLNENIYKLGDYYGITGFYASKVYAKYYKCVYDALYSIGITVD